MNTNIFNKPINFVKAKVPQRIVINHPIKPPKRETVDAPLLPYEKPAWSAIPDSEYHFEIIKNGTIDYSAKFRKEMLIVGRLPIPICDIPMEHQSISRYHAVIQFKDDQTCYLFDLDSTHGTYLNKSLVAKREYVRIRVGDMIKFGASSRIYVLQGPQEESQEIQASETGHVDDEVTWGFGQDAFEGDEWEGKDLVLGAVDRTSINSDAFYMKEPKKILTTWLESRGTELEIKLIINDENDNSSFIARISLPIETGSGQLVAMGHGETKKKAERDACIEACAKLDKLRVLRGSGSQDSKERKRIKKLHTELDGADDFFDRTVGGMIYFKISQKGKF